MTPPMKLGFTVFGVKTLVEANVRAMEIARAFYAPIHERETVEVTAQRATATGVHVLPKGAPSLAVFSVEYEGWVDWHANAADEAF